MAAYKIIPSAPKRYSADKGIVPGELVLCLSDFYQTMEVEVIDIVDVLVNDEVKTYYIFQDSKKKDSNGLVGIGKLSSVETGRRYHVEACLIKGFGEGQVYPNKDEALASLRH